jgi:hypothetical protein
VTLVACWVAYLPFLLKASWGTLARLSNPYYGFLVPAFLVGAAQGRIVRQVWWRILAICGLLVAALLLVLSPARPLFPAKALLARFASADSKSLLRRAQVVYLVYGKRWDGMAALRRCVPDDAGKVVGLVTFDDPETSLWRPFGGRQMRHVIPEDSRAALDSAGLKYVLVSSDKFPVVFGAESFEQWLDRVGGKVVQTVPLQLRAGRPPVDWFVVALQSKGLASSAKP